MTMSLKAREWLEPSNSWNCLLKVHSYANQQNVHSLHYWINVDILTLRYQVLSFIQVSTVLDCLHTVAQIQVFPNSLFLTNFPPRQCFQCFQPRQCFRTWKTPRSTLVWWATALIRWYMKMIIGLMIILAIDHLMINRGNCSDQVIYEDDHWHNDHQIWRWYWSLACWSI